MTDAGQPLRFLTDENFNRLIVDGVRRREPGIDMVTAREAGLLGLDDQLVLAYAADHERILLSHDTHTMPDQIDRFLLSGRHSPGVLLIAQEMPIGGAIETILVVWGASNPMEWRDLCTRPLG